MLLAAVENFSHSNGGCDSLIPWHYLAVLQMTDHISEAEQSPCRGSLYTH